MTTVVATMSSKRLLKLGEKMTNNLDQILELTKEVSAQDTA